MRTRVQMDAPDHLAFHRLTQAAALWALAERPALLGEPALTNATFIGGPKPVPVRYRMN